MYRKHIISTILFCFVCLASLAQQSLNVAFALPLHDVNGDGKRMVEYYRGMLMAVEKLKAEGKNVNITAWNVTPESDPAAMLKAHNGAKFDLVIGPLYTKQVKDMGDYCRDNGIKMLIPFSISSLEAEINPNIFQVYQFGEQRVQNTVAAFINRFYDKKVVFVECNDTTSTRSAYITPIRKEFDRLGIEYTIVNVNAPVDFLTKKLELNKHCVLIPSSVTQENFNKMMSLLDAFDKKYKGYSYSVFGHSEWLMFAPASAYKAIFAKHDTYIPSTYYYDADNVNVKSFDKKYQAYFGTTMQNYPQKFAITGYDHGLYFLGGMLKYGKDFVGDRTQNTSSPVQVPLVFEKQGNGGYYNVMMQLVHFQHNGSVEMIRKK